MSAVRHLIAAAWAAVWVWWRLLAVRTRRAVGGRDDAATAGAAVGSGYYLSPAEIPVEGVDYELMELPPDLAARLDAARAELMEQARTAAERRARRRRARRRRTTSLAMAALLTLALLGAGATALVGGSTGVPAIDRFLGKHDAETHKPGTAGLPERDVQPAGTEASEPIEVELASGRRLVSVAYVARDGNVCIALSEVRKGEERSAGVACRAPSRLVEALDEQKALAVVVSGYDDQVIVRGFADPRVTEIEGDSRERLTVRLGEEWGAPSLPMERLRLFVAVGPRREELLKGPSSYHFEATEGSVPRHRESP